MNHEELIIPIPLEYYVETIYNDRTLSVKLRRFFNASI